MSGKINFREQDPMNPEHDLYWDPSLVATPPPPPPPKEGGAGGSKGGSSYSLKAAASSNSSHSQDTENNLNTNTTLKRPAGPAAPSGKRAAEDSYTKEPQSMNEPEIKRMKDAAKVFGYSDENPGEQMRVASATEGFRKMYVGALHMSTTEKSLLDYFGRWGEVAHCAVIRDQNTGMTKGFGFVTMSTPEACAQILTQAVHVVDNRTIRVSLTQTNSNPDYKPRQPRNYEEVIDLIHEVGKIDVREGKIYVGQLPDNVSPNILADHFSQYGIVNTSNVSRAVHNTMRKNFGFVNFKETMAVKRVLQNPKHFINQRQVDITLSKFGMETLLSDSIVWLWGLDWSIQSEDIQKYFSQFGQVYHAMHIHNPVTGEKRGYGFVDFVDQKCTQGVIKTAGVHKNKLIIKGQKGHYGKWLPSKVKRDLMYIEDRFGNLLLKEMYNKIPDSGTWGGGKDHNESVRGGSGRTITCKLPKQMLPVVVGEDGKIVSDIARDSKTKITLIKAGPQDQTCMFHIFGSEENCKTAQYIMKIKIKEKMQKGNETRHAR